MAKGILQSPHVLSEGSDAICGENQTTTHPPDIHRPYSGGVGGEQEKFEQMIEIDTTGVSGLMPYSYIPTLCAVARLVIQLIIGT